MILIASDSHKEFKSSLSVAKLIRDGMNNECKRKCNVLGISDGGEGFLRSIAKRLNVKIHKIKVHDPIKRLTEAQVGIYKNVGFIEMAEASGVQKFENGYRDFMNSSSYGTGEMISYAINKGCKKIILGLGGAGTGDGGLGAAQALGVKLSIEKNDKQKILSTKDLLNVKNIYIDKKIIDFKNVELIIASDVKNLAIGKNGATKIFGPQKGGSPDQIETIEKAMVNYLKLLEQKSKKKLNISGSGAAGAISISLCSLFKSQIKNGFDVLSELIDLEEKIKESDWVITGEGSLDRLSLMGKIPFQIAKICKKNNKKIIGIFGTIKNIPLSHLSDFEMIIDCSKNKKTDFFSDHFQKIEGPSRLLKAGEKVVKYILTHQ